MPAGSTAKKAKAVGAAADSFDNPAYDELLLQLNKDAKEIVRSYFGRWSARESTTLGGTAKPKTDILSIEWQPQVISTLRVRSHDSGRDKVKEAVVGHADMRIVFRDYYLRFKSDSEPVERKGVLYVLCRPAIVSLAKTMREAVQLMERPREMAWAHEQADPEHWGLLTLNRKFANVVRQQGVFYFNPDADDTWC